MGSILHLFDPLSQKDASSLAICLGFYNEGLLLPHELLPELAVLRRQQPSLGEEIVVFRCSLEHIHKTYAEQVLASQNVDAWEMAHLLIQVQPNQ